MAHHVRLDLLEQLAEGTMIARGRRASQLLGRVVQRHSQSRRINSVSPSEARESVASAGTVRHPKVEGQL
ncbi:hypothetical protein Ssi02_50130 [Sinosporangium siamense]|uniref:Uncharacterized protein n=1 Tax=Sinosporangium siamense TaxID=1367973 RepID=A0A919RK87_9ACTN|nr:hypothetical protein Ssi02_50130 [Sinosporangium siamense]